MAMEPNPTMTPTLRRQLRAVISAATSLESLAAAAQTKVEYDWPAMSTDLRTAIRADLQQAKLYASGIASDIRHAVGDDAEAPAASVPSAPSAPSSANEKAPPPMKPGDLVRLVGGRREVTLELVVGDEAQVTWERPTGYGHARMKLAALAPSPPVHRPWWATLDGGVRSLLLAAVTAYSVKPGVLGAGEYTESLRQALAAELQTAVNT